MFLHGKGKILTAVFLLLLLAALSLTAGKIDEVGDATIIQLIVWRLPDPTNPETSNRADCAVINEFIRLFPKIFAEKYREKYKDDPEKYGRYSWDNVKIQLRTFSGIQIEGMGMDSGPLMAIAGGVAPDILYVNFRQSDTYIQNGFLYPLDKKEDNYISGMTEEEKAFQFHPKTLPVIKRKGPKGEVHIWAKPTGGIMGKVILYRKDLLNSVGVPFPKNDWTWQDLYAACRKLTNPEEGTYGILFTGGMNESSNWINYLWSAGGEVIHYNKKTDKWQAVFDSEAAVEAIDFYTRLSAEPWKDSKGIIRYGYAVKDPSDWQKWNLGKIGFFASYIDEKLFQTINPDVLGMVPFPIGPGGHRAAELNSKMQGIFAGIKDPAIRDAAWEYLKFVDSKDAVEIRTRIMVEGGLGRFVNPKYLRMFGYDDIIRLAPTGWEETFNIAIASGKPEPYGRNCQMVYSFITKPIQKAERMEKDGELSAEPEKRRNQLKALLVNAVDIANEKMIGNVPPEEMKVRRIVAWVVLVLIFGTFALIFQKIIKTFTPKDYSVQKKKNGWQFQKYIWAYLILIPAVASVLLWQYIPLALGSKMAFQDYQLLENSTWSGVDNFANVLWDGEWWSAVWNSCCYSFLVVTLTFLPPVILAILLDEIPKGKIIYRVLFYLPAIITGLVVIYLWKSFYDQTEYGVLNSIVLKIPAIGYILLGLGLFILLFFFAKRLYSHQSYWVGSCFLLVGIALFLFSYSFAHNIFKSLPDSTAWYHYPFAVLWQPYEWLQNPKTAMLCCVIPMVWAGMGPGCLIYLAALKGISPDFYEAADIDGANFIDKILFIVVPILKPLLIIQFVGVFINSWRNSALILAMTGGSYGTEVAGLKIFFDAYTHLKFGPAAAMAWILGFMLIGFTMHQLRILSRLEFKTTGNKE
ncbi:MAG: hypothetical protein A2X48_13070 [Lentisphaerae bacterium GWF2_49_21]|nr:MAG: hypothetical protein A2X48_13070 [Lentisphaerae bacterium GWF2_49_21]